MRKMILSLLILAISITLYSQVGINTRTPFSKSVFHIDAKGNNTSEYTVTADQQLDDVLIDMSGALGLGVVYPTAKLHIFTTGSTTKPIRIADGSEGVNKYLFSDVDGRATWKDKPMPNGVVYYSRSAKTYAKNVYTELPAEVNAPGYKRITIPRAGNYVFTLRWWGSISGLPIGTKLMSAATIQLRKVTGTFESVVDETTNYVAATGTNYSRFSFTMSLFASNLSAGDVLYLAIKPIDGYAWATGLGLSASQLTNTIYYPSIMVYNI